MAAAAMARMQGATAAAGDGGGGHAEDASQGRCSYCNKGIGKGALIFHRFNYQYCNMDCLTRHKAAIESR